MTGELVNLRHVRINTKFWNFLNIRTKFYIRVQNNGFIKATLNILFSLVCYSQRTKYLCVKNGNVCCFQNTEVDFRRNGTKALIQEETTTLPNKEKLMHHSAAFKVLKKDIPEDSEDVDEHNRCCLVLPGYTAKHKYGRSNNNKHT